MTEQAAAWSERDLDRRFHLGEPHDEVTRLGATLDGLLDRISASLRRERRFSAELSHELRTPLANLTAEAELALRRDREAAEYRQALADSRREATKIIEEARRAAEQQRARDIADLEAEKNRLLKRAKDEIDSETRSSLQAIRDQLADLTVATAEKVVRRQLDETEQRRLIDEAMADVDFSQFAPAESGTAAEGGE